MTLPGGAQRLFAHLDVDRARHEPEIVERLLEDGDRDDLRWLVGELGEERLAEWLAERGARRLSDRSRAFWSRVLGVPLEARAEIARELWPL